MGPSLRKSWTIVIALTVGGFVAQGIALTFYAERYPKWVPSGGDVVWAGPVVWALLCGAVVWRLAVVSRRQRSPK